MTKKTENSSWQHKFTYVRQGKPRIVVDGYVDLGHEDGLSHVDSTVIQTPADSNDQRAVVRVAVTTRKGTYAAHGSANPTDAEGKPVVEIAETRALARALGVATNTGLGDTIPDDADEPDNVPDPQPVTTGSAPNRPALTTVPDPTDERPATQTQIVTIAKLSEQLGDPIEPDPEIGYDAASELMKQLNTALRQHRQEQRARQA